jgi:SAM-dependent methyltransferase
MNGFSAAWLALREPFDSAARAGADAVAAFAGEALGPATRQVVDLACGTGANLRALAPRLGRAQHWRLIDHDAALLAALPAALEAWSDHHGYRLASGDAGAFRVTGPGFDASVVLQQLDLVRQWPALALPDGALLTASALLDLVSADWLDGLIGHAGRAGATLLFALSVDGRIAWEPADADDGAVQAAFAAHQRRDKGFGPALGDTAAAWLQARLSAAGWKTSVASSDWRIDGARAPEMVQALIDGTAAAAIEQMSGGASDAVLAWQRRRTVRRDVTRLVVGHTDLAARPPAWHAGGS